MNVSRTVSHPAHAVPVGGLAAAVFGFVLGMQLLLVATAGTDIPIYDQWTLEGRWLYPAWIGGKLDLADMLQPLNEHRIFWTNLLNLGLFSANGQWDPLVQMMAIAVLRAACAAGLAWHWAACWDLRGRVLVVFVVALAFLPHLAWHTVLWGIESHSYFVLGFSMVALALLGGEEAVSTGRMFAGLIASGASFVAFGPGALVPVALLGMAGLRFVERRKFDAAIARQVMVAAGLLILAFFLRTEIEETRELRPTNGSEFVLAAGRILAWPHVSAPPAALAMNAPILWVVLARIRRRRQPASGEDFVLLAGGWSVCVALATAWMRGGGPELAVGVPSRYVDFLVPLPLANVWCLLVLLRESAAGTRMRVRLIARAWMAFVLVGWIGLSAEMMRGIILPRVRDREAPVRLVQAYQRNYDVAVFAGQPRLLVPHPNPAISVRAVLDDPLMRGLLPPSLQPERPLGPLSRATRALLGHGPPPEAETIPRPRS